MPKLPTQQSLNRLRAWLPTRLPAQLPVQLPAQQVVPRTIPIFTVNPQVAPDYTSTFPTFSWGINNNGLNAYDYFNRSQNADNVREYNTALFAWAAMQNNNVYLNRNNYFTSYS